MGTEGPKGVVNEAGALAGAVQIDIKRGEEKAAEAGVDILGPSVKVKLKEENAHRNAKACCAVVAREHSFL